MIAYISAHVHSEIYRLVEQGSYHHMKINIHLIMSFSIAMNDVKLKVTTESKGPRTDMLLVYAGDGDSSNQPKIKGQRQ